MTPSRISTCTYLYVILAATLVGIGLLRDPAVDPATPPEPASKVRFTGNTAVSSDRLRAAIAEQPLFDDAGTIIDEVLERDLLLLSSLYWDLGHAQVKIGAPIIPPSRDAVTIPIEEGPVFTMGPVTVTGDLIGTASANLKLVRTRQGLRFSRSVIANDVQRLGDFYRDQGYAYANVLPLTKVDLTRNTIGLTIEIERGKRAYLERIEIDGNSKTPTRKIRNAIPIAVGDLYTNVHILEGKRRVEALGFHEVAVSTKRGSSDELVVVTFEVTE